MDSENKLDSNKLSERDQNIAVLYFFILWITFWFVAYLFWGALPDIRGEVDEATRPFITPSFLVSLILLGEVLYLRKHPFKSKDGKHVQTEIQKWEEEFIGEKFTWRGFYVYSFGGKKEDVVVVLVNIFMIAALILSLIIGRFWGFLFGVCVVFILNEVFIKWYKGTKRFKERYDPKYPDPWWSWQAIKMFPYFILALLKDTLRLIQKIVVSH